MTDRLPARISAAVARAVCTLPTEQLPLRRAEFDDLFATAVDVERTSATQARLRLFGPADLVAYARDLTTRETECCSFFTFTVVAEPPDHVVVDIRVPPAYAAVLDAVVERARSRSSA